MKSNSNTTQVLSLLEEMDLYWTETFGGSIEILSNPVESKIRNKRRSFNRVRFADIEEAVDFLQKSLQLGAKFAAG